MEAPKTLRRPANWPDFETLSKKLWGEIWNCPDIRKNGRNGNNQHGVDVYGIPEKETEYFGIQCKGKDEYTDKQLSQEEILNEIKKAKTFEPPLKKLYFATTAVKNADIEQFVRKKNVEHLKAGLFGIEIYAWEDIVDLIDENKQTHDWYLKNQNFKVKKSVSFSFHDNSTELSANIPFKQEVIDYRQKAIAANPALQGLLTPSSMFGNISANKTSMFDYKINHSYFKFYLRLHNTGIDPIEDFKIFLEFEGDCQEIDTVTKGGGGIFTPAINYTYDTFIDSKEKTGTIVPHRNILVGEDTMGFDDIKIKPLHSSTTIIIHWKLVSKDFKDNGQLKLNLIPEIKKEFKTVLVEDPLNVRVEEKEIEDYITDYKEKV